MGGGERTYVKGEEEGRVRWRSIREEEGGVNRKFFFVDHQFVPLSSSQLNF